MFADLNIPTQQMITDVASYISLAIASDLQIVSKLKSIILLNFKIILTS